MPATPFDLDQFLFDIATLPAATQHERCQVQRATLEADLVTIRSQLDQAERDQAASRPVDPAWVGRLDAARRIKGFQIARLSQAMGVARRAVTQAAQEAARAEGEKFERRFIAAAKTALPEHTFEQLTRLAEAEEAEPTDLPTLPAEPAAPGSSRDAYEDGQPDTEPLV